MWLGRTFTGSAWWRHQMETFSSLLAICAGNSLVTGEFPAQRPVTRRLDVFFDLRLNKRLSKQWRGWWFETPSRPIWCHCNGSTISHVTSWHGNIFSITGPLWRRFLAYHCKEPIMQCFLCRWLGHKLLCKQSGFWWFVRQWNLCDIILMYHGLKRNGLWYLPIKYKTP